MITWQIRAEMKKINEIKRSKKAKSKVVVVPPAYIYRLSDEWGVLQDDALNPRL